MRYRRSSYKRKARVNTTTSNPESLLQRRASSADSNRNSKPSLPPMVNEVLRSPGQPLDASTRSAMEARFGHDFSRVRVHADSSAAESARMVNARAYTVGQHIAFGAARFDPHGFLGQKLLAHELTHVVQQAKYGSATANIAIGDTNHPAETEADHVSAQFAASNTFRLPEVQLAGPVLQREDEKPKRVDVALVLDDDSNSKAEAGARASTVLRVTSVEDAKAKLKALSSPIGTLYIISHGNKAGQVQFVSDIGTISWVSISTLGSSLKGAMASDKAPQTVDFGACKVGEAGDELESFRKDVGAAEARGTNCWTFTQDVTPLTIDGTAITDPSQIPEGMQAAFDKALMDQVAGMQSEDGHKVGDCLIGLAANQSASKNLKKIKELYFKNQGRLVASWVSPEFNKTWQEGSLCSKNMTTSTKPCWVVKKVETK